MALVFAGADTSCSSSGSLPRRRSTGSWSASWRAGCLARCSPRPWWPARCGSAPAGLSLPRVCSCSTRPGRLLFAGGRWRAHGDARRACCRGSPNTAGSRPPRAHGILRYLGADLLLYCLVVAATEAFAHAWESRRSGIAAATYARQLAEARLHVLSAQLQPHFLFNTLHAISALVYEDPARAERLLARLSDMLRLTLRSGTRVETTLAEELALLRRYAEIQETALRRPARGWRSTWSPRSATRWCPGSSSSRWWRTRSATASPAGSRPGGWTCAPGRARAGCTSRCPTTAWGFGRDVRSGRASGSRITRARLRQLYGPEQQVDLTARAGRRRRVRALHPVPARGAPPPDDRPGDPRADRGRRAARAGPAPARSSRATPTCRWSRSAPKAPRRPGPSRARIRTWCSSTSR